MPHNNKTGPGAWVGQFLELVGFIQSDYRIVGSVETVYRQLVR